MKVIGFLLFSFFSVSVFAQSASVASVKITGIQTYATEDDSVLVWIHTNNNGRVGPNPVNPEHTCELWTYDNNVLATAMLALSTNSNVNIRYKDRGEGTYWCVAEMIYISSPHAQ